jgi:hypothetical protein
MADRPHRPRHQYGAEHPFRHLHPSRELWRVRVPIDLLPQNPLYVDEDSLVARGYADHVVSAPGLLRLAFRSLRSAAAALCRAIALQIGAAWHYRPGASQASSPDAYPN